MSKSLLKDFVWRPVAALRHRSTGSIAGISTADLLNPSVDAAPVMHCDEIGWAILGISMAGWKVLVSLGLALVWAKTGAPDVTQKPQIRNHFEEIESSNLVNGQ